jgi:hypothetical protein
MWGAFRWTARFLLLVVLAPVYGPLAMACSARPAAMHCVRQPISGQPMSASTSAHAAQTAMPCHHGASQSKATQSESPEISFQDTNDGNCCPNHCCCGATTSEWAQPASSSVPFLNLLIEPAHLAQNAPLLSSDIYGHDSARAPPRG